MPLRIHDISRMRAAYRALLVPESKNVRACGMALFERIATGNWSVEWNLPRWLGSSLGLGEFEQQGLIAANVFGLGYIRLHDDQMDGEGLISEPEITRALERALLQAAEGELRQLAGERPAFWNQYTAIMKRWKAALDMVAGINVLQMEPSQLNQLGDIGAPLYLCGAACAALRPQTVSLEAILRPIQHYLVAAVLYDHMKDWKSDLENERANVFIQAMDSSASVRSLRPHSRHEVYAAILEGEQPTAYIDRLHGELSQGMEAARSAGLEPFALHLAALAEEVRESKKQMDKGIQDYLKQGMELLLPA